MSQFSVEHSYHAKDQSLVIHIDGEFKGVNVRDFEKDLVAEIRSGRAKTVVFELSKVVYVDSAAIEFLFNCAKICKEAGQSLRLSNPRENIRKLFNILRVERIIPIENS
jgi:anti-anti-sigma factor